jgi:hypothetical protein
LDNRVFFPAIFHVEPTGGNPDCSQEYLLNIQEQLQPNPILP